MSAKENGVTIQLEEKVYRLLEEEAKKDGLTVPQEIDVVFLCFLKKYDPKRFEEAKRKVDSVVLRVFKGLT